MSDRTFQIESPHMKGSDVRSWQQELIGRFSDWDIPYVLVVDGDYGVATRAATASFMHAWGVADTGVALEHGLSAAWRSKLRHDDRNADEAARFESDALVEYRRKLRARFVHTDVAYPVTNLITDAWGWHPGVHDGVDLITAWKGPCLAICTGKIVRVAKDGWWGNNPQPSPGHPISDGDGIVILESTIADGPFQPGLHFCYGHAENATVRVGDHVNAGQVIAHIGFANAAHTHFMVNKIPPSNGFYTGRGDRDPMPFLDYAKAHG